MRIGYGFWGFLGDKKFVREGDAINEVSTPDGNAFYSWSIIRALQKDKNEVFLLMPDRDEPGYSILGEMLFDAWGERERLQAYQSAFKSEVFQSNIDYIAKTLDFVIWEWRWLIPGRNDIATKISNPSAYQPDYELQDKWLTALKKAHVPVFVMDLDFKLEEADIIAYSISAVIELGDPKKDFNRKWFDCQLCDCKKLQIPFDFSIINTFDVENPSDLVVYVGNRYERDWCVDRYLPTGTIVHGNWLEKGRTSETDWPHLVFKPRLQLEEMRSAYAKACVTPLLAKREYCKTGFMTARVIEAVFYGCVPLFLHEFVGASQYVPLGLENTLIVKDKIDVYSAACHFMNYPNERKEVILKMRYHLRKMMDVKIFLSGLYEIYKNL